MRQWMFFLLVLALALLPLSVHVMRELDGNPFPPGELSYYHARIAHLIWQGQLTGPDPALPARTPARSPYHFMLAFALALVGPALALRALPWLCGLLVLLLADSVLKRLRASAAQRIAILIVLAFSPLFISAATFADPRGMALVLLLAGIRCALEKGKAWKVCAALALILHAGFGVVPAVISVLVALLLPGMRSRMWLASVPSALFAWQAWQSWSIEAPLFLAASSATQYFSDFGSLWGISLFALALALVGMVRHSRAHSGPLAVALLVFAFFYPAAIPYAMLVIAVFAGLAFASFWRTTWALHDIKCLLLFVIICGIALAGISHAFTIARMLPNSDMVDGLLALQSLPGEGGVLSHPRNGAWIAFFTRRPVMLDTQYHGVTGINRRYADLQTMLYSTDLQRTKALLDRYNVSFVFITRDMRESRVWERPDQGLLLLLQNNETFKKRSATGFTGVWQYMRRSAS